MEKAIFTYPKILLFVLLLGSQLCLAQNGNFLDKLITYDVYKKDLQSVLLELSDISERNISFKTELVPKDILVSINAKNQRFETVLKYCLKDAYLTYEVVGNQIILKEDIEALAKAPKTLSGYIEDIESGERLPNANIYLKDFSKGVTSNAYGYYSLTLPKGIHNVIYSFTGYSDISEFFELKEDKTINIQMQPSIKLNEIVILDKYNTIEDRVSDAVALPLEKLRSVMSLGGEADILRLAQTQAGITSGADGFGGIHVRGGEVDQNLILYDGVPVYHAGHALSVFSIFNPSTIKSTELIKNGFPARYGGRLSSVVDVRTKEGNSKSYHGDFSIGSMAVKGTFEGPIIKDRASFIFSARRTFLDPWIKQISKFQKNLNDDEGYTNYYFYDYSAKVNFSINRSNRLFFSYYNGIDKFNNYTNTITNQENLKLRELKENVWDWGNTISSIRWNSVLSKKLFLNITAYQTEFGFDLFEQNRYEATGSTVIDSIKSFSGNLYKTQIKDKGIKADLEFMLIPEYVIRIGGHGIRHKYNPGLLSISSLNPLIDPNTQLTLQSLRDTLQEANIIGSEYNVYLENQFKIGGRLFANIGVHASNIDVDGTSFQSIQPRASLQFNLSQGVSFSASYSGMNQYLHLLSNSGLGLPNDIWLPSTPLLKPQESKQSSVGFAFAHDDDWVVNVSGYYKTMSNMVTYPEGGVFSILDDGDWESELPIGKGKAYGGELSFKKNFGKFSGWCNYTLAWSKRKFNQVNLGREFFARYDRRHNFKMVAVYRINERTEFSFNYTYGSGHPFTVPTDIIASPLPNSVEPLFIYTERNNVTLPNYHRLDFGFNFYSKYKWGQQKITFGLYNAYNRQNPFYIDIRRNRVNLQRFELVQISIFPILPAISYNLAF